MKLISATIVMFTFTLSLCAQVTTNSIPHSDIRAIRLENASLSLCLNVYSQLTGKKVNNETTSPVGNITFRSENAIPKDELVKQLESRLKEKGVELIPSGTNELRAVTINTKAKVQQQRFPPNRRSPSAPVAGGR